MPHITLKSIANNAEIDVIWEQWQETLEPLRAELNDTLGRAWEEWEIPREPGDPWPDAGHGGVAKASDSPVKRREDWGAAGIERRAAPELHHQGGSRPTARPMGRWPNRPAPPVVGRAHRPSEGD